MADEVLFTIHCKSQTRTNVNTVNAFYNIKDGSLSLTFLAVVADTICEFIHLFTRAILLLNKMLSN